jgi:hypothetical protein
MTEGQKLQKHSTQLRALLAELRGEIVKQQAALAASERLETVWTIELANVAEKLQEEEADSIDLYFAGHDVLPAVN